MKTSGAAYLPRPRSPEPWCLPLLLLPGWPVLALAPRPGGSKFDLCCDGRCCNEYRCCGYCWGGYCCGAYCCGVAGLWEV